MSNERKQHAELSQLAAAIAAELPDYEHHTDRCDWTARAIFRHKSRPVWFAIRYDWKGNGQRLSIQSELPPRWQHGQGFTCPHGHTITVSKRRTPRAIAGDIGRRFLSSYAPEYVERYQAAHQAERNKQATAFEREQLRQTFGGTWRRNPHGYHGEEWTESETGLQIRYNYRDRPTFSIETPAGEPARLMALALRYAIETINNHTEKQTA